MSDIPWEPVCSHVSYHFHHGKLTIRASSEEEDLLEYLRGKIYQTFSPECTELIKACLPSGKGSEEALAMIIGRMGHILLTQASLNMMAVRSFALSGTTPLLSLEIINACTLGTFEVMSNACTHVDIGETARQSHDADSERLRRILEEGDR